MQMLDYSYVHVDEKRSNAKFIWFLYDFYIYIALCCILLLHYYAFAFTRGKNCVTTYSIAYILRLTDIIRYLRMYTSGRLENHAKDV